MINPSEPPVISPYDPARRALLSTDRAAKALCTRHSTGEARSSGFVDEHALLQRVAGLRGVPKSCGAWKVGAVEGLTLERIGTGRGTPPARLFTILVRLSWYGVAHNDIRDENLVRVEGGCWLIDFDQGSRCSRVEALGRNVLGLRFRRGSPAVYGSYASMLRGRLLRRLPACFVSLASRLRRRSDPSMPPRSSASTSQERRLWQAWANLPRITDGDEGERHDYALSCPNVDLPGRVRWDDEWPFIADSIGPGTRCVLVAGANVGMIASTLLRERRCSRVVCVEVSRRLATSANLIAAAFAARPEVVVLDQFDGDVSDEISLPKVDLAILGFGLPKARLPSAIQSAIRDAEKALIYVPRADTRQWWGGPSDLGERETIIDAGDYKIVKISCRASESRFNVAESQPRCLDD